MAHDLLAGGSFGNGEQGVRIENHAGGAEAALEGIVPDEGSEHEKYTIAFTIDLQRCIFCGFCQEACPKGAIKLNNLYELAQYDKQVLILDIERATQSKPQLRLGDWL